FLARSDERSGILRTIRDRLSVAKPKAVRHAYLDLAEEDNQYRRQDPAEKQAISEVKAIRHILRRARNKMLQSTQEAFDNPITFELFTLVEQLMDLRVAENDLHWERTLRRWLKQQSINGRFHAKVKQAGNEVPQDNLWLKGFLWSLRGLATLWFWATVTGRIPILSGRWRWFLRQPHLAPGMSGTVLRFALRLTDGRWNSRNHPESDEYVKRLLVNSFLEDLRRAYRLRPWQVFRKQFWCRRRMTYPVLLLDSITPANGGYELLQLINKVR